VSSLIGERASGFLVQQWNQTLSQQYVELKQQGLN